MSSHNQSPSLSPQRAQTNHACTFFVSLSWPETLKPANGGTDTSRPLFFPGHFPIQTLFPFLSFNFGLSSESQVSDISLSKKKKKKKKQKKTRKKRKLTRTTGMRDAGENIFNFITVGLLTKSIGLLRMSY
jgi:hypothetical protein